MADGLFVAASGAIAQLRQLDVVANNLANAATPGFQPDAVTFAAVLGARAGRAASKQYVEVSSVAMRRDHGPLEHTGNPLDVAIRGDGYLRVLTPRGPRLTRDGRLVVGADQTLQTVAGYPVLDTQGKPLFVPSGRNVDIAPDGMLRAGGVEVGRIGLWTAPPGQALVHDGEGLLRLGSGAAPVPARGAQLAQGFVEHSAADPVRTIVQLVEVQRNFDATQQAMQAYRQMDRRATSLARVS